MLQYINTYFTTSQCYHATLGGGEDYVSGPYTVTFEAGYQVTELNFSVNADNITEDYERFFLAIDNSPLPSMVTVGPLNTVTVYIIDDGG